MQPTARRGVIAKHVQSSRLSRKHRPLVANALMHLVNDGVSSALLDGVAEWFDASKRSRGCPWCFSPWP